MKILDRCKQITDTESGRVLLYRDEVEAVLTAGDTISRQAAIDAVESMLRRKFGIGGDLAEITLAELPSAQPNLQPTCNKLETDCISRQGVIDVLSQYPFEKVVNCISIIEEFPSAQPEQRTCVNCGRTVNNGGWYADGGTRCPIEEHYALPKDGYCHLWEKRNVTDDDYPEGRADE